MCKIPVPMSFSATVSIPAMGYPSLFVTGQHNGWDQINASSLVIDLPLEFWADVEVDWEASLDEVLESIETADWTSDYSDESLRLAIQSVCQNTFDESACTLDEAGDGCDGVILIEMGEDVSIENVEFPALPEMSGGVAASLTKLGKGIANDCAFEPEDGYEGTWFYTVYDEEIHQGNPLNKENWK